MPVPLEKVPSPNRLRLTKLSCTASCSASPSRKMRSQQVYVYVSSLSLNLETITAPDVHSLARNGQSFLIVASLKVLIAWVWSCY